MKLYCIHDHTRLSCFLVVLCLHMHDNSNLEGWTGKKIPKWNSRTPLMNHSVHSSTSQGRWGWNGWEFLLGVWLVSHWNFLALAKEESGKAVFRRFQVAQEQEKPFWYQDVRRLQWCRSGGQGSKISCDVWVGGACYVSFVNHQRLVMWEKVDV